MAETARIKIFFIISDYFQLLIKDMELGRLEERKMSKEKDKEKKGTLDCF